MRYLIWSIGLAFGCGSTPPADVPTVDLPEVESPGFRVTTPPVALAPGSDSELCTWSDRIVDTDTFVASIQAWQSPAGHHAVIYTTSARQPPGTTRLCTDEDMLTFRYLAVVGREGGAKVTSAPEHLAYRIPHGTQIVVNHHYINATTSDSYGVSALNFVPAAPGRDVSPVGALAVLTTDFAVVPGSSSAEADCTLPHDWDVWMLYPHMHERGSRILARHDHAGHSDTLFDVRWNPSFSFDPPVVDRRAGPFLHFSAGDRIHLRCDWQNPGQETLYEGREMCVAFALTVERDGAPNLYCDAGAWRPF